MLSDVHLNIYSSFMFYFPPNRASTKSKAPSPPPLKGSEYPDVSGYRGDVPMEQEEAELSLVVVLPGGVEETTSVHGR